MQIVLTVVFGFLAGIAGGMGLGGGTLLITLFQWLDYSQTAIQAMNLLSFIPMAVIALHFHFKNGLVETQGVLWIAVPAVLFCILGAILATDTAPAILKICFGIFLAVVGAWEIVKGIKEAKEPKKEKTKADSVQEGEE